MSERRTMRGFVAEHPRDVTQGDIARKLGLTESEMSSYMRGRPGLAKMTALRLSRQHGFDLEELLDPKREHEV